MVRLNRVSTTADVAEAVTEFNRTASSWSYARDLARTTHYWVFDPSAATFGPSKFVGYTGLDPAAYETALAGDFDGARFDGNVTRKAIESALQHQFQSDDVLSGRLVAWGEALFGEDVFEGLDTSKWRFVTLAGGASNVDDRAAAAVADNDGTGKPRTVYQPDGTPLDATFRVERIDGRVSVVVESRGGSRGSSESRNLDYAPGLEMLLARLGNRSAKILDAIVESRATQHLELADRRLQIDGRRYPITIDDAADLQRRLGAAQARVGREPGARGSGNRTKRLRLVLHFAETVPSHSELEDYLAGGGTKTVHGPQNSRPLRTSPRRNLVGQTYANIGRLPASEARQPFDVDPDKVDRGNQAHASTQDALADFLRARGITPLAPQEGDPKFDLAWKTGGVTFVAEVKSTTVANREQQLRLGLGQVLRYRYLLAAGGEEVRAVLVAEKEPTDSSWLGMCDDLGVVLTWPGAFDGVVE
ncbi:MAG: hypothetical protein ACOY0T_31175 [Myxococcota bacterium]